jgi:hypothetical protein
MSKAKEMTAREYRSAIGSLARSIGPRAQIWTTMNDAGKLFRISLYSRGIGGPGGNMDFTIEGDEWGEMYKAVADKWDEYEAKHRSETIRKMALSIIRITAELGECTDAALRNCGEFDPGQVRAYGEHACSDANEIAGKGPFSIVVKGGANAEVAA